MTIALYPGSFDPLHNGHLSVLEDACLVFDQVIVAVGYNPEKPSGYFSGDERVAMIKASIAHLSGVSVRQFSGLVTVAAQELGADCLVKGVRGAVDLDVEMQQSHMNRAASGVTTVLIPARGEHSGVSSTYVRQIGSKGGDISTVVPDAVLIAMNERVNR